MYLFMCRHVHMFLGPVFSFLVLKLLWNSHLPENMFMCTNVMKGKKERNKWILALIGGGEICGYSGESALKSEPSFGGNPAAQVYKPSLLAGSFVSAGEWVSWRDRTHLKCNSGIPVGMVKACCAGSEMHAASAKRQPGESSDGLMCS